VIHKLNRLHPVVYVIFIFYIVLFNTTSNVGVSSMKTVDVPKLLLGW
jgi:hypothetical protein